MLKGKPIVHVVSLKFQVISFPTLKFFHSLPALDRELW